MYVTQEPSSIESGLWSHTWSYRRRIQYRNGRETVQNHWAVPVAEAIRKNLADQIGADREDYGHAALDAGILAVFHAERHATVRDHGRAGHQRHVVPVQRLRAGDPRWRFVEIAGGDRVRVRGGQPPWPVQIAPVQGPTHHTPPDIKRVQLLDAHHLGRGPVLLGRLRVRDQPGRHRQRIPDHRQQPVGARARVGV